MASPCTKLKIWQFLANLMWSWQVTSFERNLTVLTSSGLTHQIEMASLTRLLFSQNTFLFSKTNFLAKKRSACVAC
jgi:hypothetical protein